MWGAKGTEGARCRPWGTLPNVVQGTWLSQGGPGPWPLRITSCIQVAKPGCRRLMPQDRAARRTQLGNELVLGNLFPGVSELGVCVRTRGATFLWFAAGSVLGFELSKGGVGRGWGGHESLADEKPSPPSLCKLKQLSCLSCQCLLLNLGSKGGGGEGGREGGPGRCSASTIRPGC